MENNELTYIFGAGASCHSMPLVDNFSERFNFFINVALGNTGNNSKQIIFTQDCIKFISEVQNHLSFDTFFKKLYHQGFEELIIKYKKILVAYFTFEHLRDISTKNEYNSELNKSSNIDLRYDALIAGLLKPKKETEFFTKVNFITWNYDLNLLTAIKNFLSPSINFDRLITKNSSDGAYIKIHFKECSLIHINGIAYHPYIKEIFPLSLKELKDVIVDKLINEYHDAQSDLTNWAKMISFAWEREDSNIVEDISSIIKISKNVVIVGYSFPLYNRLIDQSYLNEENLRNKKVVIQDIDLSLGKTFIDVFSLNPINSLGIGSNLVDAITNCKSFFVPSDIFTNKS